MTDQTPEVDEDEGFPPVHFELRNTDGQATEVQVYQRYLGFESYVLIQPEEGSISVEGSGFSLEDVAVGLGIVLGSLLQAQELDSEIRDEVLELISAIGEDVHDG